MQSNSLFSFFFFFKQKTAYEISTRDWSSDVCSSDLVLSRYFRSLTHISFRHRKNLDEVISFEGVTGVFQRPEPCARLVNSLLNNAFSSLRRTTATLSLQNEVLGQGIVLRHRYRVFDSVFQLPHVTRPIMHHQFAQRLGREAFDFLFHMLAVFFQEVLYQRHDVIFSLAQWRKKYRNHVDSIKKIVAKQSLSHLLF